MPKRTNNFQSLVYAINLALADDSSATVTESEELVDSITGKPREVDIVVRTITHGIDIVISFECTSAKRKATVPWVEGLIAKHNKLESAKLILVSQAGFSKPALETISKSKNVEGISFEKALDTNWSHTLENYKAFLIGFGFELASVRVFGSTFDGDPEGRTVFEHKQDSTVHSDLLSHLTFILGTHDWVVGAFRDFRRNPPERGRDATLLAVEAKPGFADRGFGHTAEFSKARVVTLRDGEADFLLKREDDSYMTCDVLLCLVRCELIKSDPLEIRQKEFLGNPVSYGSVQLPENRSGVSSITVAYKLKDEAGG